MPLTFAHPAAAIPLRRVIGRAGVLSALVIGSVVPDLRYFVPLPVSRDETHSLLGLLWFCLPVGMASYAAFHLALKQPLCALLPTAWQERLAPLVTPAALPAAPWWAVAVSIVAGAATHLAWDLFTHASDAVLAFVPILDVHLFTLSGYRVNVHNALFHASTLLGVALIARWTSRWLRQAPPVRRFPRSRVPRMLRTAVFAGVLVAMALAGLSEAELPDNLTLRSFQHLAVRAGIPSLGAFGVGVLLYCAGWHGVRAARRGSRLAG